MGGLIRLWRGIVFCKVNFSVLRSYFPRGRRREGVGLEEVDRSSEERGWISLILCLNYT